MSGDLEAYHKIHKILSYGGKNVRFINPRPRG